MKYYLGSFTARKGESTAFAARNPAPGIWEASTDGFKTVFTGRTRGRAVRALRLNHR